LPGLACPRAEDAPANFLTLLHLVDAEKAWAAGENDAALVAFDLALREAQQRERPWQLALTTERAARFHLARGLEHTGRSLLREAHDLYDRWGAAGKVHDLQRVHGFLKTGTFRSRAGLRHVSADASSLSSDSLDLLAILRASQALSSETSLPRLKSRVVEVLGALTGATQVLFISRGEEDTDWFVSTSAEKGGDVLSVAEAGACGMLPLSIFRYAERTREPLLLDDATRDDRFSRDSYFAGLECCSLLAAPILSQGVPRAVLLLENRSSRSAFSADRLDAVMLMAGQLGVSLDTAGRYEMLERKVSERTAELANSLAMFRATLESATDAMVAVDNTGQITTCNEHYLRMWGVSREQFEGQRSELTFPIIARQLKDVGRVLARIDHLVANPEEESSDIVELSDGRVFEEYSRPQRIGNERTGRVFCFHEITGRRRAEAQLQQVNEQLIEASRQGGMAEVATNVLHNVGNVLTSVNVSATVVADSLRRSRVAGLQKAVTLMHEQGEDLPIFMASERGRQLPVYLAQLAAQLQADQTTCVTELELLRSHIEHIRDIVTMQQTYARTSAIKDVVLLSDLVEDSLRLNLGALSRHGVQIVREFEPLPPLKIEKHKVLQVLVNLISNAKYAYDGVTGNDKHITLRIARDPEAERARISVIDNGVGIPEENLTRIFNHGFTTRAAGHGFGLHSSALAAREMGGSLTVHSEGTGAGATFVLELPFDPAIPS
jgi:PAS domain S-box-containing protein